MEETIEHGSGLSFLPPATGENYFSSLEGKTSFGWLLNNPAFRDLEGFSKVLDKMDNVEKMNAFVRNEEFIEAEDFKAIRSKVSGRIYSFVSPLYEPVQDKEMAFPLFDALQARGIGTLIGRVDGVGSGMTRGHVILANPDFTIRLLEDYPDDVMLGIRFWNSYTRQSGFGAEIFGVRTVCINYCLWGSIIGSFKAVHMGNVEAVLGNYEILLEKAMDASPVLQSLVAEAVEVVVETKDIPDLLWGIQIGPRAVESISSDLKGWVPEVKDLGLNAWTLYNAATAYLTYRPRGGTYLQQTEYQTRQALRILTESHDRLIEKGKERKIRYEESLKKKKTEYAEQKATIVAFPSQSAGGDAIQGGT